MKVSSSVKLFSVGLMGMAFAGMANAEEGVMPKIEIRGALVNSDHGNYEVGDNEVDDTMNIIPERAKLQWRGAAHSNVDMRVRVDMLKLKPASVAVDPDTNMTAAGVSPIDHMYFDWKFMPKMKLRFGQDKVVQKGWDMNFTGWQTYKPVYSGALSTYAPVLGFIYEFMGDVHVQILDDQGKSYNKGQHPTFNLEWRGKVMNGQVMPLVQYSTFDNQKSSIMAFGAQYKAMGVNAWVSYTMEHVAAKGLDADGEAEDQGSDNSSLTIAAHYTTGGFEPFFYYNMFNNEQYTAEGVDQPTVNSSVGKYDDNGTAMHLGLRLVGDKNVQPYVEYVSKSGVYDDPTSPGDEVTLTGTSMKVGVFATM